jgi:hypothetical protein
LTHSYAHHTLKQFILHNDVKNSQTVYKKEGKKEGKGVFFVCFVFFLIKGINEQEGREIKKLIVVYKLSRAGEEKNETVVD